MSDADSDSEEIIYNDDNSSLNPDNSFNDINNNNNYLGNESIMNEKNEAVGADAINDIEDRDKDQLLQQSPEFKGNSKAADDDDNEDDEIIDNDDDNNIGNKMTINLPNKVSKEEFDVGKDQEVNAPIISPSPIKKKLTIDEVSLNVELKNNNEFIDMEHFDEASKIGFGLGGEGGGVDDDDDNDNDGFKQRIKILNKEKYAKESPMGKILKTNATEIVKEEEEQEEDMLPKESPYKKLMKNYDREPILPFTFLRINNQVLLQQELQTSRTYNKFITNKIAHYIERDTHHTETETEPGTISKGNKNSKCKQMNKEKHIFKAKRHLKQKTDQSNQNTQLDSNNNNNKGDKINTLTSNQNRLIANKLPNESNNEASDINYIPSHLKFKTINTDNYSPIKNDDIKQRRLMKDNSSLRETFQELNSLLASLQEENDQIDQELQKKNEKLTSYLDKYDLLTQENQELKAKAENLQVDYNIEVNESQKKSDKITELQGQYEIIDQDYQSALKKQEMDSIIQKETRQSFETYKGNYTEMRSQYDLLSIKYQTISDENFNFKRDVLLYEKELKNKSDMIDKLRINCLESAKFALNNDQMMEIVTTMGSNDNSNSTNKELETQSSKLFQKEKDKIRSRIKTTSGLEEVNTSLENDIKLTEGDDTGNDKKIQMNRDKSVERIKALPKQDQVKQIEGKISKIIQERNHLNSDLNRLPEHLRKKDLIDKRSQMESKIENLNSELGKWRTEIKALKVNDKD